MCMVTNKPVTGAAQCLKTHQSDQLWTDITIRFQIDDTQSFLNLSYNFPLKAKKLS